VAEVTTPVAHADSGTQIDTVVLVASGKGGVGKSTVASHLARSMASNGFAVGLLDADIHGPTIAAMFDVRAKPRVRDGRMLPVERHGVRLLSLGQFLDASTGVRWHGPVLRGAIRDLYLGADWGRLDMLVVDLPPGAGEVQEAFLALRPASGVVFVTIPDPLAASVVRRTIDIFVKTGIPVLAVVENMNCYLCPHCDRLSNVHEGEGGAELAAEFNVNTVVSLPFRPRASDGTSVPRGPGTPRSLFDEGIGTLTGVLIDKLRMRLEQ
jgi:ATP-binding protein involved in chromosome partitioning